MRFFRAQSSVLKIGVFFIALLFVLCSGVFFHGLSQGASDHPMGNAECCLFDGQAGHDINHMASITVKSFSSLVALLAMVSFLFSTLLFDETNVAQKVINYIRSIREKYGGFRILNYLQNLFSQGILHSRDFFVFA